tara:strand:- start:284 stop:586 length:303 start_codon:yes stop_codon:yes gene_type:complete
LPLDDLPDELDALEDLSCFPELPELSELLPESLDDPLDDLLSFFAFSAGFFLSEFLKSVSYQPVPFSRKAAADTCLRSAASPHSGQKTNGSSDNFCKASR